MQRLNVIIIELSEVLFEQERKNYLRFFKSLNLDMFARHATNERAAKELIRSSIGDERVNIVICDITFDHTDFIGLNIIRGIKTDFPDLYVIGSSGKSISYDQTITKFPTFDQFISKVSLNFNNSKQIADIKSEFLAKFRINLRVKISSSSVIDEKKFKNAHLNRELCSLVSQCCSQELSIDEYAAITEVVLTPLTGGRSGSHVFRMDIFNNLSGLKLIPAVLKVSKGKYARIEANNYRDYVKWMLPYDWRVELLGEGETKLLSAVCYSFISSGTGNFDSLTVHLEAENIASTKKVIDGIFSPDSQRWYSESIVVESSVSINEYYAEKYFGTQDRLNASSAILEEKSQKILNMQVSAQSMISKELSIDLPNPVKCLMSFNFGSFLSGICHGDLNSNNIILADNGEVIFIDFQATDRGHVFTDFIAFEHSIRLCFGQEQFEPKKLLYWEGLISKPENLVEQAYPADLPEVYKQILDVRRRAVDNFRNEKFEHYIYGVTMYSIRLLRVQDFNNQQQTRLLCQIFSGTSHLQ